MPSKRDEIGQIVKKDHGDTSAAYNLYEKLVERIQPDSDDYLPVGLLAEWMGRSLADAQRAADYLASDRVHLLEAHFELIDDDDDAKTIDESAVYEALVTGVLVDPDTGGEIPDWPTRVAVYYSGTRLLAELARERVRG